MKWTMQQDWMKSPNRAPENEGGDGANPSPEGDSAAPSPAAPDYSFLPEAYRGDDGPDLDGFKGYIESLEATKAQFDERAGEIPESADGYEFSIPEIDFKEMGLPEDFALAINPEDEDIGPLLKDLGGVMHKNGMPKEAATDLMGILAKYEAASHMRGIKQAEKDMAEQAKALGPKAEARVSNVKRLLESRLSTEEAQGLMGATLSANALKGLEKLMSSRALGSGEQQPTPARTPQDDLRAYYEN